MSQLSIELFEADRPATETEIKQRQEDRMEKLFDGICEKYNLSKRLLAIQPLQLLKQWLEEVIGPGVLIERIPAMLDEYKNSQ
jgi:hypothetical protein